MTMTRKKKEVYVPQSLVVHYSERSGETLRKLTIVLCDLHRQSFYSHHPEACGYGEWKPLSECEICKKQLTW